MTVEISGVRVALDGRPVLHDVTLAASSGTWTAIVGPNGAGKSTLLRAVLGLVRSEGAITVDGADPRRRSPRERARSVAYAPQSPQLPDGMTVFDYALLGRSPYIPYLGRESASDRRVVRDVLGRLGLEAFADRDIARLSGGERQRAVLARALAQQAALLLLDEPTTALDIGHQQQVMDLIDDLRRADGLTVLTTVHDLTLAGQYADRLVLLAEGRVAAAGAPREVLTAETVAEHFGARVYVQEGPDGRPVLGLLR
ncbi:ABC transporter [Tsukamurella pulmonis]|uniref:Iron complex transport system ATP-binding protein n=1 Tax=Tsukamurella pulmonis TaxID=47312 RepID=A0A1H1DIM9_9ACTN|nr:ABC transporter ATP-binding protein [Tsukamurella pulmonis]KXO92315.1 ABC transporter [Tsukamurella pulmonis]SDQ76411.1 iron complex transport system ATP-binding protein [Tsukamurella pulmonis]SUP22017.1 Iron(3+)-hydroxamate import ATP-binding protein FhuC [Tsukamurella pulmonis]